MISLHSLLQYLIMLSKNFNREGSLYLACNEKRVYFTSEQTKRFNLWSCQKVCDALHYLLENNFIRIASKLYRQVVDIPMGTNCAPLVADLFYYVCRETSCCLFLTIIKQIVRAKENLKLSSSGPSQRQASGTHQGIKALRQGRH